MKFSDPCRATLCYASEVFCSSSRKQAHLPPLNKTLINIPVEKHVKTSGMMQLQHPGLYILTRISSSQRCLPFILGSFLKPERVPSVHQVSLITALLSLMDSTVAFESYTLHKR